MKIDFFTIVLNGMPWITHHLPIFNQLPFDWTWHIVEGAAKNTHCTSWCKQIIPQLSTDGTTEYLMNDVRYHPRVKYYRRPIWDGKIEMINHPLQYIKNPTLLWQVDSDEIWNVHQIHNIVNIFNSRFGMEFNCADFWCDYFVGMNIVVSKIPGTWTNHETMWRRVWRYEPGMYFDRHEPPVMHNVIRKSMTRDETKKFNCVFQHYAYATKEQVEFKEKYYGYVGAVRQWELLQNNKVWPVYLRNFFPWVKDAAMATKVCN